MTYVIDLIPQKSSLDNSVSSTKKVYFRDTGLANLRKRAKSAKLEECYLVGNSYTDLGDTLLAWDL